MGLFDRIKPVYTGEVGSIVRIPCKSDSSNLIFTGTGKSIKVYEAIMGKRYKKGKIMDCQYFGLGPAKDVSESSYSSGYTATHTGNGNYRVTENKYSSGDAIAMEVVVGSTPEVAMDKKSNVNRWIHCVAHPTRGFLWWVVGVVTVPVGLGILMLASAFYRLALSFRRKACLRKAKKSYKQNKGVIVF